MQQPKLTEGFNPYEVLRRLHTADLVIHTIPGEQWTLSCNLHKTLLVDVYTLTGKVAGSKRPRSYVCGRLSEILLRMLWYGRKVQYLSFEPLPEDSKVKMLPHTRLTGTLEEYAMSRLSSGDIVFRAIPGETWRLSSTCFGMAKGTPVMFYLAEESTLGTSNLRICKSTKLEQVLLQFLCQDVTFVEHSAQAKVLEFKGREQS